MNCAGILLTVFLTTCQAQSPSPWQVLGVERPSSGEIPPVSRGVEPNASNATPLAYCDSATHLPFRCKTTLPRGDWFGTLLSQHTFSSAKHPHIILVIIDALRADRVNAELMPSLHQFQGDNLSFDDTLSNGTSTHHSMFSMYYARPGYEREKFHAMGWRHGSPMLRVLQRAGYSISVFGDPLLYGCPSPYNWESTASAWSETSQNDLLHGHGQTLLKRCPPSIDRPAIPQNTHDIDSLAVQQFLAAIGADTSSSEAPGLYVVHLDSAHSVYGYNPASPRLKKPGFAERADGGGFFRQDMSMAPQEIEHVVNAYDNGVMSVDENFGNLVAGLRRMDLYEDSIVVVLSDHGESLPTLDSPRNWGHGWRALRDEAHHVLTYRFPHGWRAPYDARVGGQVDVFPTLFDYIELRAEPAVDWLAPFWGRSIFAPPVAFCFVSVSPHGHLAPRAITLSDGVTKGFFFIDVRDDQGDPAALAVQDLTDMFDKPLDSRDFANASEMAQALLGPCMARLQAPDLCR